MSSIPWHTSGPSRAIDPYYGLRLADKLLVAPALTPWENRLRRSLHTDVTSIPWHTSGPSRSLDPYYGLRLDEHVTPSALVPWNRGFRPSHSTMSMIPWHTSGPSRNLDPYFGLRLKDEDFLDPLTMGPWEGKFIPFRSYSWDALWPVDTRSVINKDKDKYEVNVDVQHFKPEELEITLSGNTVTIEGRHEEKADEHGLILRHFVRRVVLPEDHDLNLVQSHLFSDGVLTITVPKKSADGNVTRNIPIQHTGKLKKSIKHE